MPLLTFVIVAPLLPKALSKGVNPHLNIITSFHSKVKNDFAVILNLQNQNQHLKEARDILLPRLMSGMIDVDGLEVSEKLGMVAEEQANHTQ